MRKSFLTATALATVASFAAAPVAPAPSSAPAFKLDISGAANGYLVYQSGTPAPHKTVTTTLAEEFVGYSLADDGTVLLAGISSTEPESGKYFTFAEAVTTTTTTPTTYIQPATEFDANILFNASMVYEGMSLGASYRFDAPHETYTGRHYFISIGFDSVGTFSFGAMPGAAYNNWIFMPGAGAYTLNGGNGVSSEVLLNLGQKPWYAETSNKLMFKSGDMGGFVVAASWTPYNKKAEVNKNITKAFVEENNIETNIIEVQGKFSMDDLTIGAGFASQEPNGKVTEGVAEGKNSFNVLANYEIMGIKLGAGYIRNANFSTRPSWSAYGGMEYAVTPAVSIGAGYLQQSDDHPSVENALIIANVTYKLAPGASWQTGVHFPTTGSNWSIATGLSYSFKYV